MDIVHAFKGLVFVIDIFWLIITRLLLILLIIVIVTMTLRSDCVCLAFAYLLYNVNLDQLFYFMLL